MVRHPVNILVSAKQVLLDNKWTKGVLARKANGRTNCDVRDPTAKCFCTVGALYKAAPQPGYVRDKAMDYLEKAVGQVTAGSCIGIADYNDSWADSKKDIFKRVKFVSNT